MKNTILGLALVMCAFATEQKASAQEIKNIKIDSIKEASAVGIKNCGGNIGSFNSTQSCFAVLLKGVSAKDALGNAVTGDMIILGASQFGATDAADKIALSFHGMTVGDLENQRTAAKWVTNTSLTNVKVITSPIALSSLTGETPTAESPDRAVMLGGFTITATNHWRVDDGIASQVNTLTLGME